MGETTDTDTTTGTTTDPGIDRRSRHRQAIAALQGEEAQRRQGLSRELGIIAGLLADGAAQELEYSNPTALLIHTLCITR